MAVDSHCYTEEWTEKLCMNFRKLEELLLKINVKITMPSPCEPMRGGSKLYTVL